MLFDKQIIRDCTDDRRSLINILAAWTQAVKLFYQLPHNVTVNGGWTVQTAFNCFIQDVRPRLCEFVLSSSLGITFRYTCERLQ